MYGEETRETSFGSQNFKSGGSLPRLGLRNFTTYGVQPNEMSLFLPLHLVYARRVTSYTYCKVPFRTSVTYDVT